MSPIVRDARGTIDQLTSEPSIEQRGQAYACTVVSFVPIQLHEEKPHLFPAVYVLPAAKKNEFVLLHVGESHHFIPDPFDEKRNYKQVTPPHEMARSICDDYNTAHIGTDSESGPGLFWVHGRLTIQQVKDKHSDLLEFYQKRQTKWFHNLVSIADADWEKNKNRLAVSDLQRIAAQYLGIQKDWVIATIQENMTCPFCKALISVDSVKCYNCKEVVNPVAYKKMMEARVGQ